jgi:hypothetical protein
MFQSSSKDPAVFESECGTGAKCSYGVSIINGIGMLVCCRVGGGRGMLPDSGWLASPISTTLSHAIKVFNLGPANAENSFQCPSGTLANVSLILGS